MPSSSSNVVTFRPRAWSATAGLDNLPHSGGALAGQLARSLGPRYTQAPYAQGIEPVDLEQDVARFRDLFERSPVGVLVMDLEGRIERANAMAAAILGWDPTRLRGKRLASFCEPSSIPHLRAHLKRLASGECFDACELELLGPDQGTVPMHVATLNVGDGTEGPLRAALLDGSGLRELEDGLALAASVVEHTAQGIVVTDAHHRVVAVNPAFTYITGYRADEILGQVPDVFRPNWDQQQADPTIADRLQRFGHWQGEVWSRRRTGEPYTQWVIINAIRNPEGAVTHYVCMVADMTSHEDAKQELRQLAYNDSLTGLANRVSLLEQLSRSLVSARREKRLLGLLYLDLDRFKDINDTLGHSVGDRLLQFVAEQLRGAVRQSDLVARLGGDEFTILVPDLKRDQAAGQIASNILRRLADNPFVDDGREIRVGASIGIALFPKDAIDSEGMLSCADAAMYEAKRGGRNGFRFHSAAVWARYREGHALESGLRRALERQELKVLYQPVVGLRDFRILGGEALLQWQRPAHEPVDPALFLSLAEKTELIVPFEHWALQQVADQTSEWRRNRGSLRVSLDLSTVHLRAAYLERLLQRLDEQRGAFGGGLELELRESALMDCPEQILEACGHIQRLGINIALDHFGSGLSSLTQLRHLPLTRIKLDGNLLQDLGQDPNAAAVVSAVVALGRGLGLKVLAQDVETPAQLEFLREAGCDEAQGALFSPPLPADLFSALLGRATLTEPGERRRGLPERIAAPEAHGFLGSLSGALDRGRARLKNLTSGGHHD
ncbi:MAG: putative bifunctional diguanylate cyclase/phosphodiesterase [Bdellovibrio bacteriovorus]